MDGTSTYGGLKIRGVKANVTLTVSLIDGDTRTSLTSRYEESLSNPDNWDHGQIRGRRYGCSLPRPAATVLNPMFNDQFSVAERQAGFHTTVDKARKTPLPIRKTGQLVVPTNTAATIANVRGRLLDAASKGNRFSQTVYAYSAHTYGKGLEFELSGDLEFEAGNATSAKRTLSRDTADELLDTKRISRRPPAVREKRPHQTPSWGSPKTRISPSFPSQARLSGPSGPSSRAHHWQCDFPLGASRYYTDTSSAAPLESLQSSQGPLPTVHVASTGNVQQTTIPFGEFDKSCRYGTLPASDPISSVPDWSVDMWNRAFSPEEVRCALDLAVDRGVNVPMDLTQSEPSNSTAEHAPVPTVQRD